MTREEAKGFGYGFVDNSSNIQSQYVLLVHEVDEVIDKIYDDIESRICNNCKYSTNVTTDRYIDCNMDDNYFYFRGDLPKNFGCNKFERKLESK